jgi:hypothetical protein
MNRLPPSEEQPGDGNLYLILGPWSLCFVNYINRNVNVF